MSEDKQIFGPHFHLLKLTKPYQNQKSYQKTVEAISFQDQVVIVIIFIIIINFPCTETLKSWKHRIIECFGLQGALKIT